MRIISLSKKTLKEAIELTLRCFPDSKPDDFDYPGKWLPYSLKKKKEKDSYVSSLDY